MKNSKGVWVSLLLAAAMGSTQARAAAEVFELGLHDAEGNALKASNRLKAAVSDREAAGEQTSAVFAAVLPRLTIEGSGSYVGTVPSLSIAGGPAIALGSNWNYSLGPVVRYTLWDTFSSLSSYHSFTRLEESRAEDQKLTQLQVLMGVRSSYLQVQLSLEELRLVNGSYSLIRAQGKDISNRYHAGAASRLDLVTSERAVLSYDLMFRQQQAAVSSAFKDLLSWIGDGIITGRGVPKDLSKPGPPGVDGVSLVLQLDPLTKTLVEEGQTPITIPDDSHPQARSQELLAESAEYAASAQKAKLLPVVQISASTTLAYPNGPILQQINQNSAAVSLVMPLWLGDPTWHLADEKLKEAESARHREDQIKIEAARDFSKAAELLSSLREQKKLAEQDVLQADDAAKLYYTSYQAGKSQLIDVQTANNQALQAKVNAARIDAQIIQQLINLKALSGKEVSTHE